MRRSSRFGTSRPRGRSWSVARQLLVLQLAVVGVLVLGGAVLAYLDAESTVEEKAAEEVVAVAATIADSRDVREAVTLPDPSVRLQPFAERVRADTGVGFITIMDRDRTRYTHPDPDRIGEPFIGTIDPALRGRAFTETYTGTLGPSVRAVAPVFVDGDVVALVAVGITVEAISTELAQRLSLVLGVAAGALFVGVVGSVAVSNRLRAQTRGVAPEELSRMFDYYEAILHSVREGLVLVDRDGRVGLYNDAAADLLDLRGDVRGFPVAELGLADALARTLTAREQVRDELHVTETRVLLVNTVPVRSRGRAMGNVVTLRDHTELQSLTGELDTVRGFAESLRAQAHESANRLHAVVSLVELGRTEQAVALATAELRTAQELTDRVLGAVSEPVLAALLLGKLSEAAERGVELVITDDTVLDDTSAAIDSRDLITVLGNLVDNAMDAAIETAADRAPTIRVTVKTENEVLVIRVADSGPGIDPAVGSRIFRRGWSTKSGGGDTGRGLGLALVGQTVRRLGGTVTVANAADSGAVFTVRIPLSAASRRAASSLE
ncbi:ATP-binding protein [Saccharomonospora glauca]|uniref:histidine kinase n=1 Tax=Saccharomonospora glauca K62 TaxID=928724 RepID=I1D492_9PSEU|nr:sensor histidine kinase [Saccharomonospora glauca]EIE99766.1 signal transduction histidine kinase regulating citrate/malate metabolism [Saccharomonospora glauca K62]